MCYLVELTHKQLKWNYLWNYMALSFEGSYVFRQLWYPRC